MTKEKIFNNNPHPLIAESLQFNLQSETEQLQDESAFHTSRRIAKTLVKYPDLRVVLTVIQKGEKIHAHKAEGRISIQPIKGRLKLQLPEQSIELRTGDLLTLDQDIVHDVEALEDSAFLLTIAWHKEK